MPRINCYIPIRVRLSGVPSDDQLDELGQVVGCAIQERLALADRTIAARYHLASLSGETEVREAYEPARAENGYYQIPAYDQPGWPVSMRLRQTTRGRPWVIRKAINFHARVVAFLEFIESLRPNRTLEQKVLYIELFNELRWVSLWLVQVNQDYSLKELEDILSQRATELSRLRPNQLLAYGLGPSDAMRQLLVELDEDHLVGRAIPILNILNARYVRGSGVDVQILAGGWVIFASMVLPKIELVDVGSTSPEVQLRLKLRDLDFLVPPVVFEQRFHISWQEYLKEWGDSTVALHLQPVTVIKKVHQLALEYLMKEMVLQNLRNARGAASESDVYYGNLFVLNHTALRKFPPTARSQAEALTDDVTRRLDDVAVAGDLAPNWKAIFAYTVFSVDAESLGAARYRPKARRLTPLLLGKLSGDEDSRDWQEGLLKFLRDNFNTKPPETRPAGGTVFEYVLADLEGRGGFDGLFDKVEGSQRMALQQRLALLTLATRYAAHERLRRLLDLLQKRVLSRRNHIYRPTEGEIWLERKQSTTVRLKTALGDVDSIYIFERKDKRLKPARLPAFKEALTIEREEMIKRILKGQDLNKYTEEEFLRTVMVAAVQRIHLSDDDFEKITIQRSIRLLKVEGHTLEALPRFFVTFDFVERVKGEDWQSVSQPITEIEDDFEARLIYWRLGRAGEIYEAMAKAITVVAVIAIAWEAGLIAALVEAAGGATAVLVTISISELIYVVRVAYGKAELSLQGFLEAALDGYLMALGFRGASFLGRFAAQAIGKETLTKIVGGWVAERLIVGGVGGAGAGALTTFSHDLINVATGEGGWSGFRTYVRNMAIGAAVGIVIEFVGMPVLKSLGRTTLESLTDARDLARLIRAEGIGAVRWTSLITEGLSNVRVRLSAIIGDAAAQGFVKAMSERLIQVAEELGARFVSRRVLELAEASLTRAANNGLEKMLGAAESNPSRALRLFNSLADNPQQAIAFLEVVNGLEESAVRRLLEGTFGRSELEMARFLARLSRYSVDQQRAVVRLLLELGIEAAPPRAGAGGQSLLQRQFAASLRIQAGGVAEEAELLQQQAAALRQQAYKTEAWNPDRAARLRERAERLDRDAAALRSRLEGLQREAAQVSGGQAPTPQLPGPADIDVMFGQVRAETLIRIPLDQIERNPEAIERLVRPIFRSRSGNRVVFRVEGGASAHARSQELIHIDASGQVRLTRATLNMNFGVFERAIEFILEHRPGARLKVFEVDEAWFKSLRSGSIPERGLPADPSLPGLRDIKGSARTVDVRFAEDQLQIIDPDVVKEFEKFIIPGSGRTVEIKQ